MLQIHFVGSQLCNSWCSVPIISNTSAAARLNICPLNCDSSLNSWKCHYQLIEAEWRIYTSVIQPPLVQIMACRLVSAKPLSEPMLEYCTFEPQRDLIPGFPKIIWKNVINTYRNNFHDLGTSIKITHGSSIKPSSTKCNTWISHHNKTIMIINRPQIAKFLWNKPHGVIST